MKKVRNLKWQSKNWLYLSCLTIFLLISSFIVSAFAASAVYFYLKKGQAKTTSESRLENFLNRLRKPTATPFPTIIPTPAPQPTTTPPPILPTKNPLPPEINIIQSDDNEPWGVAKQIDEHTWSIKVKNDERMATPLEIFEALNYYRINNGRNPLTWVPKLADYAQSRATYLNQIKENDNHQGFYNFLTNEDGYHKLGFYQLGENTCYGYQLLGVHLIEWIFAGDKSHNDNQLDSRWGFVGIGVDGLAVSLIFGGEQM